MANNIHILLAGGGHCIDVVRVLVVEASGEAEGEYQAIRA